MNLNSTSNPKRRVEFVDHSQLGLKEEHGSTLPSKSSISKQDAISSGSTRKWRSTGLLPGTGSRLVFTPLVSLIRTRKARWHRCWRLHLRRELLIRFAALACISWLASYFVLLEALDRSVFICWVTFIQDTKGPDHGRRWHHGGKTMCQVP